MKLNVKQKSVIYKIIFFGVIQILCYIINLMISAKLGDFVWTPEMLTSSLTGNIIQILNLVLIINAVILFVYVVIFVILLLKS